jgi:hypothetical protein
VLTFFAYKSGRDSKVESLAKEPKEEERKDD